MIQIALASFFALSFSVSQEKLDDCERDARANPNDYETMLCLNRLKHKDSLKIIDEIELAHPDAPYLDMFRGNHHWNHGTPEASIPFYRKAVTRLEALGDETRAIHAQANLAKVLLLGNHTKLGEKEILKLQSMYRSARKPLAKRRGLIHWANLAAFRDRNIGQAYDAMARISPAEIGDMNYLEQRDFYLSRGRLSGLLLRFEAAKRDFQELGRLALEQSPPEYTRYALALNDALSLELRGLELSPEKLAQRAKTLERELLHSIEAAKKANRLDMIGTSLYNLARVYAGTSSSDTKAIEQLERCLKLTEDLPSTTGEYAQCLGAKSRFVASKDPAQALEMAQKSLALLDKSSLQELRLSAWRNIMRRAWAVLPTSKALGIAHEALDQIEGLRSYQRDKTARQLMFAVWTQDYAWLASRLFTLGEQDPEYLPKALEVLERSRARVLLEYMPEPIDPIDQTPSPSSPKSAYATLPQLQAKLESDEAMLVYQIANQRALNGETIGGSWVLLVTRQEVRPIKLDLERFELEDSVSIVRDMARYDDSAMHLALDGLAEKLLEPATRRLSKNIRNLIIVADGPLHALPFFSIDPSFNYTLTPSATIWSKTRLPEQDLKLKPAGMSVVDPKRTLSKSQLQDQEIKEPGMVVRDAGIDVTQPLHEGRRESQAIKDSLSPSFRTLAGSQATPEQLVKGWKVSDNVLHISAHSQVDTEVPEQSKILLSNVARKDDGSLTVSDIYKLPLDNDVVVLAGCSTGWGNWVAGEGILSLARAFQIAGASAVVASLWPIRDNEAADFFEEFYANLGKGQPIALALSTAQQTLRDRNYPPQAYEGYVIIGDGRIRFDATKRPWSPWVLVIFALAPLALVWRMRKAAKTR